MPREKPLAVGTLLTSRSHQYQVKRLVGGGGMAWVYQVKTLPQGSNSLWALKELRPQAQDPDTQAHARQLFNQEAMILSQLSHPNLPQVIDFFEDQGRSYLVMEFIWGESLEKRLEKARSPLMEREVLQWAVQICDVLGYLHTRQPPVIFRDLKPSNVMVSSAGMVKLVDFGIARTYKENKLQDTIALGSENYAAPEQWGQSQTDPRSDIYGLGATMYHLLGNMPPSPAFLPSEPMALDTLNGALAPETVRIVHKAMARNREDRFQSAQELKEALLACLPGYVPPPAQAMQGPVPFARAGSPDPATSLASSPERSIRSAQDRPARAPGQTPVVADQRSRHTQHESPPGAVIPSEAKNLPAGQVVRRKVKLCPRCKHKNELASRFCVRCGYAFVGLRPAVLRVIGPVRAAWEMPVHRSPLMLGRADPAEGHRPDFDMTFYDPDGYVSRRHAHIMRARNGYFITDLGSSNGTYINGTPLSPQKPRLLRNGDKIEIGAVTIQFLLR